MQAAAATPAPSAVRTEAENSRRSISWSFRLADYCWRDLQVSGKSGKSRSRGSGIILVATTAKGSEHVTVQFAAMVSLHHHFSTYSTSESGLLGWVLERATKTSLSDFMSNRLWKPTGMEPYGFWMLDGPEGVGREFSWTGGLAAVARDYVDIGWACHNVTKSQGGRWPGHPSGVGS